MVEVNGPRYTVNPDESFIRFSRSSFRKLEDAVDENAIWDDDALVGPELADTLRKLPGAQLRSSASACNLIPLITGR